MQNKDQLLGEVVRPPGLARTLQNVVHHLEQAVSLHVVIVHQVDKEVGAGDSVDDLSGRGISRIDVAPVGLP